MFWVIKIWNVKIMTVRFMDKMKHGPLNNIEAKFDQLIRFTPHRIYPCPTSRNIFTSSVLPPYNHKKLIRLQYRLPIILKSLLSRPISFKYIHHFVIFDSIESFLIIIQACVNFTMYVSTSLYQNLHSK